MLKTDRAPRARNALFALSAPIPAAPILPKCLSPKLFPVILTLYIVSLTRNSLGDVVQTFCL